MCGCARRSFSLTLHRHSSIFRCNKPRRGATVRILLDSSFDDPGDARGNTATAAWVNAIASTESLDLAARIGDPTGRGIHAKVVLVHVGAEQWSHVGSINGSEVSSKDNRELALQVDSAAVHGRLRDVFLADWSASAP